MVICFDATKEAKRALDSLIGTAQFKDTSEAISMALVNYEVIQRAVKENREVLHADIPPAPNSPQASTQPGPADASSHEHLNVPASQVPRQIPSLFQLRDSRPSDEDLLPFEAAHAGVRLMA